MSTTTMDFRTVVARTLMLNHFDTKGQDSCDLVIAYAKSQGIPVSNVVHEAQAIAEEGFAMLGVDGITDDEARASIMRYCRKALTLVCRARDRTALPYLESKTVSQDEHIRSIAANGIINILGTDSIEFIRKVKLNGLYRERDLYNMYETFGGRLKAEIKEGTERDRSSAYEFLLGLADKEEASDTAKMLDQILCETLDGYAVSIQREQTAERMIRNGPDHSRPHFEGIKSEIERTPREKRIDVRQRLKKAPAEQ